MKQQDKVFMTVGGGVVTALAVATGIYLFGGNETTGTLAQSATASSANSEATASTSDASSAATSETTDDSTSTTSSSSSYKDGTYSASVNYYVPHGTNSLTAKITVKDGKVTALSTDHEYADHESGMYVDSFESAIKSAVVGQDVGSLSLSRVGGATLTTQAFDDALTTIRNDAKA